MFGERLMSVGLFQQEQVGTSTSTPLFLAPYQTQQAPRGAQHSRSAYPSASWSGLSSPWSGCTSCPWTRLPQQVAQVPVRHMNGSSRPDASAASRMSWSGAHLAGGIEGRGGDGGCGCG